MKTTYWIYGLFVLAVGFAPGPERVVAAEYKVPEGVRIELTEDFYRALQGDGAGTPLGANHGTTLSTNQGTTLGTNQGVNLDSNQGSTWGTNKKDDDYLRQIAVASKYMVESNLQILEQQKKIVELLKAMAGKK